MILDAYGDAERIPVSVLYPIWRERVVKAIMYMPSDKSSAYDLLWRVVTDLNSCAEHCGWTPEMTSIKIWALDTFSTSELRATVHEPEPLSDKLPPPAASEPIAVSALEPTVPASSSSPLELELPPEPAPSAHPEPAPPATAPASPAVDIFVPPSAAAIPALSEKIVPYSDDVIHSASPIIMGGGHRLGSMIGDLGLAALAFIPSLTVIILRAHTTAALIGSMQCPVMPSISGPPVCFNPGG